MGGSQGETNVLGERADFESIVEKVVDEVERRVWTKLLKNLQPSSTEKTVARPTEPNPPVPSEPTWTDRLRAETRLELSDAAKTIRSKTETGQPIPADSWEILRELLTSAQPKFQECARWISFFEAWLDAHQFAEGPTFRIDWLEKTPSPLWRCHRYQEMVAGWVQCLIRRRGPEAMIAESGGDTVVAIVTRALAHEPFLLRSAMLVLFPDAAIRGVVFKKCARIRVALGELLRQNGYVSRETLLLGYGFELAALSVEGKREFPILLKDDVRHVDFSLGRRMFEISPSYTKNWSSSVWLDHVWQETMLANDLVDALKKLLDRANAMPLPSDRIPLAVMITTMMIESGIGTLVKSMNKIVGQKLEEYGACKSIKHVVDDLKIAWQAWNQRNTSLSDSELTDLLKTALHSPTQLPSSDRSLNAFAKEPSPIV